MAPCFKKKKPVPAVPSLFALVVGQKFRVQVIEECRFDARRMWRIDYAIDPNGVKIALEVEGGAFVQGRHTRGAGFAADMEKYNALTLQGWKLLRVAPRDLLKTNTLEMIAQLLGVDNCL